MNMIKKTNLTRIKQIYISPTLIYIQSTTFMDSNKVIRKYKYNSNDFFRVTFIDENFNKCFYFQEGTLILDHIL